MSTSIGTTRVEDVMITNIVTVSEADKMEDLAKVLEKNDINSAPVVNDSGECVGIITNHDLAEYEAGRIEVENEFKHGYFFDLARYGDGMGSETMARFPKHGFNQVSFHMTKTLETAELDDPLSKVARKMCGHHIHHIVVLDHDRKVIGILSSLDILGHVIGEPVHRKAKTGRVT